MTPEEFIRSQITAREAGKVIDPCHLVNTYERVPVSTPWGVPGSEWQGGHHTGEDHACPVGSLATAVTWGTVIGVGVSALGWGQAYGLQVIYRTRSGKYDVAYCHLSKTKVKVGDQVVPGQILGLTGYSGNVIPAGPAGAHLHFEVRPAGGLYGSDVDPMLVKRRHTA